MSLLHRLSLAIALLLAFIFAGIPARAADEGKQVRLYALDCGRIDVKDMGGFSDTGEYDGKPGSAPVPCFVIRHPKGTLLWDLGLGDQLALMKGGIDNGGFHMSVDATLLDQLKALGLSPADITYMAFSHFHFDHTGNANAFPASTWILNTVELDSVLVKPGPFANPDSIKGYKTAKTRMIDGDHDVFGDGTVRILKAPGHTPGHQVLMLKLEHAGTVILSGDLYHVRENREFARIPAYNVQRADTLASFNRIETILKNTKGRIVIQHDTRDFNSLPKFPKYLD